VNLRFEHESFGVYEQVTLAAFDLLATIVTALSSAHPGRLDRLAIHYACARLGVPVETDPNPLAQRGVHPLPGTIQAELPEVVLDTAPGREIVRKQAPRTAAPYDVEDGVKDLPCRINARAAGGFGSGKVGFQAAPFGIGEVGWISSSHAC
jgi:hypothetical protein